MLGVENYGSDVESDDEVQQSQRPTQSTSKSTALNLPPPAKKSSLSLPPPSGSRSPEPSSSKPSSSLALPPPKTKRGPKKIAIALSDLPDDDEEEAEERPAAKKPRLEGSKGASSLLSMLPEPKQKAPAAPAQERILGSGRGPGLVFNTSTQPPVFHSQQESYEGEEPPQVEEDASTPGQPEETSSTLFLPPSLVKGKPNISTEGPPKASSLRPRVSAKSAAPAVDFFSLGASSASSSASNSKSVQGPTPSSSTSILTPTVSSAPKVEDFTPPEPTPTDLYPGYYQLPSGQWAAHNPDYYRKFAEKWKREYDAYVRALEKGHVKGFEGVETEGAQEVDAAAEMERAKIDIQEKEERKALTQGAEGAAAAPRMNIKGAALGGRARTRHQLSTLLSEAYTNRETLEEKIAQGKRNRKEAGSKYGF